MALGDSAAQGVGVDDPADGYVSLVGRHLAEITGRNVRIVNLSVSGATVKTLLTDHRMPPATGSGPRSSVLDHVAAPLRPADSRR